MKGFNVYRKRKYYILGALILTYNVFLFSLLLNITEYVRDCDCHVLEEVQLKRRLRSEKVAHSFNVLETTKNNTELRDYKYMFGDDRGGPLGEAVDIDDVYRWNAVQSLHTNDLERNEEFSSNISVREMQKDVGISPGIISNVQEWHSLLEEKLNSTSIFRMSHLTRTEVEEFRKTADSQIKESLFYKIQDDIEAEISGAIGGDIFHPLASYTPPCWKTPLVRDDDRYKGNPYYKQNVEKKGVMRLNSYRRQLTKLSEEGGRYKLRCLPSVYIAGVTKSGTTDFAHTLRRLPGVLDPVVKETMYWTKVRMDRLLVANFHHYIDLFDGLGIQLMKNGTQSITYDASPSYLWEFLAWRDLPANKGLKEPRFITAHTLRSLYPDTKIIILLRNPVERLYSQYRMWYVTQPAQHFHAEVEDVVSRLTGCLQSHSVRACLYGKKCRRLFEHRVCRFLSASMYDLHVRDWLAVFPRHQVLVIKAEEYFEDRARIMEEVALFLGLEKLKPELIDAIRSRKPSNSRRQSGRSMEPMMNSTTDLLNQLFKPLNGRLADLLSDRKWLWD